MSAPETALPRPAYGQFSTALRFSVRDQTRNRLAGLLLVLFVPVWYLVMDAMASGESLDFKLYATGEVLHVDGGRLTLISAGLNSVTMIAGFVVFDAVRKAVAFDRRLVFAGYRQSTLIGAKTLAVAAVSSAIALYTALAVLFFWRPTAAGWFAVLAGFTVIALTYGALGLLLGVLVKRDLEGFFLIIMGGLMDTFLQNPLGNPLANKPVLQWFPSFGPMQFAVGGSFGGTALWGHLFLGLAWAVAFGAVGLVVFRLRTRDRTHAR
ncbi:MULTISPECIES: ABC transporter permease [unclassified Streptomyces]|uniref:ABC transporter permease n=1 Tax=unclassified Streptomyces TaxID=2593676 RepID=UPI003D72BE63